MIVLNARKLYRISFRSRIRAKRWSAGEAAGRRRKALHGRGGGRGTGGGAGTGAEIAESGHFLRLVYGIQHRAEDERGERLAILKAKERAETETEARRRVEATHNNALHSLQQRQRQEAEEHTERRAKYGAGTVGKIPDFH